MRHGVVVVLAVAACLLGAAPPASAQAMRIEDGNDTTGVLDVRRVTFDGDRSPRWVVRTFAGWTASQIWDHGWFIVDLDTRRDGAFDERLVVRSDGRELRGTLVTLRASGREIEREPIPVDKPNRRTMALTVALRKLSIPRHRASYFWSAASLVVSDACHRTCVDRVPDDAVVEVPLEPEPA